jgi:hypothetical protein
MLKVKTIVAVAALLIILVAMILAVSRRRVPDPCRITGDRVTKVAVGSRIFSTRFGRWPANMDQMVRSNILISADTNDAWGHPLLYVPYDFSLKRGTVMSYGADAKPGGVAEAADIIATFW